MKSVKKMLLGIAFLIIAACAVPFWVAGATDGAIFFCIAFVIGLVLCLKGFFTKE